MDMIMMLKGIRLKANPTASQKLIFSQWMGCARFIWNAKCDEERYYTTFAKKYYPIGTYAPIDQKTSQFKNKNLTPWLYAVPSQIIRNSAVNWYQTFQKFIKGQCGKPKRKPKTDKGSVHLTRELFKFEKDSAGVMRLFIGTKTNNIGYLSFKSHRSFKIPNSIYIKKEGGQYTISFCYENAENIFLPTTKEHLDYLKSATPKYLNDSVIGIDRGIVVPAQAGDQSFDFTPNQKKSKMKAERYIKRLQRKIARQKNKNSHRRAKTKHRVAKHHAKCGNIRQDFSHKTSRSLVNSAAKIFVFEDLKTSNMTKSPKAKMDHNDKFIPNKASAKAGLNKAILDKGWHKLEVYTRYKAFNAGKAVFKISAIYTSQECAHCGHIHPDNRKSQAWFQCGSCGHVDNADRNASIVIKQRAIKLILNTGTVLSDRGVLTSADTGRGAKSKSDKGPLLSASGDEPSKKKRRVATLVAA
jgi:putative transposase